MSGIVLVAAALTMGLAAGVFLFYAHTIMPGLRHTDDRTFVGAFQAIDRAIINPLFKAAGDPDRISDLARVRRDFNEARWAAWNVVRAVLSSVSFGCLLVALIEYGRRH